ncbi:MAG: histidinol dehydrogenase, partial [Actinomycetota bacterium]
IDGELATLLQPLPETRARAARATLGTNGGAGRVGTLADACDVVNAFAPEHLQLALSTPRADEVAACITNAGEVLVGQHTPFSAANFVLGVPASLPTSGFAAVSSGITAAAVLKKTANASANE